MHRQSLGSPGSKHHGAQGIGSKDDALLSMEDLDRKNKSPSLPDDDRKNDRHLRSHSPPPHNLIHLIPFLIFLCFLILYLCSHDPQRPDLADFNSFQGLAAKDSDSIKSRIGEFGRFLELDKGDVMAIRSLRNLQEIGRDSPISKSSRRLHRKLADF